jgi:hypothetical protein
MRIQEPILGQLQQLHINLLGYRDSLLTDQKTNMDALQTDSSKSQIPYTAGWKFTVREHIPTPPKPVTSDSLVNSEDDERERMRLSPLERCLRHPPLSGSTGSSSVNMEVACPLRIGDNHNAQVLAVRLLDSSAPLASLGLEKDNCILAKIYDPLFIIPTMTVI